MLHLHRSRFASGMTRRHAQSSSSSSSRVGGTCTVGTSTVRCCATWTSTASVDGEGVATSKVPPVAREVALKRWGAVLSPADRAAILATRVNPTTTNTAEEYAGVLWHLHERMDFGVEYMLPASWTPAARARENLVNIQASPPRPSRGAAAESVNVDELPSVHGMSLTAFAYHTKVKSPDDHALMASFFRQFNRSVGNSLVVVGSSDPKTVGTVGSDADSGKRCRSLVDQSGGAIAEVRFCPPQCVSTPARGICRAFFGRGMKTHYVALFAVPEDEARVMADVIAFAISNIRETVPHDPNQ